MNEKDIYDYVENVYLKISEEYEFSLSKSQIMNIASHLLKYNIMECDFLEALEYTAKIRTIIKFYTTHVLSSYNTKWNYYNTIDYAINRVLSSMGIIENRSRAIPFDDKLESEVSFVEDEIRLNNMFVIKR